MTKPLNGVRIVELAGIGPGPHAAMILADLGAEVVRVTRPGTPSHLTATAHTLRGRRSVVADLKDVDDLALVKAMVEKADVLVEGFRPGVLERLGLGPEDTREVNPRLIHARMTGWGQTGPLAHTAGHDINYISLTGALHAIGTAEHPVPPLNLVGDYGGGSMMLVTGVLAALFERERTGVGQVVDAGMVDGASVLLQGLLELRDLDQWTDTRHDNILDGAAPFYRTYACSDGGFMAVGAIEPQFYALLVEGLGLELEELADRDDKTTWQSLSELFAGRFAEQSREHWTKVFDGTDACVTPVLSFAEAVEHPHVAVRRSLVAGEMAGSVVATVAPRLGATPDAAPAGPTTEEALADLVADWS
ncbi:alpha-methylacyl-CoA racemase [Nocardioides daedukensis]|uniref:Alpha-methylacyl-CoA racemase n=1 Tax=Nocardioides daedukensis TaxID=634462 RepID=A0A7Y9UR22_9ACTN|nr:CaiB/BaiF CoA-transferase family protein [Nocardioides daedukensis]NYG59877.1 alpha-methylacyl-CoA racemase [Nocardioides daedukensis]